MIYRLDNVYDARGNAVFDQVGLKSWGPHVVLGDGVRLGAKWKPLAVKLYEKRGRSLPELTMLTGYALVAKEQVAEFLTAFVGESVEPLPLKSTGQRWLVLNVLDVVDGLDRSRSRLGTDWTRARLAFKPRRVEGRPIFKLAGVINSPVFVDDELKALVEAEQFKGLRFVPVGGRSVSKRRTS
jgi:hypothetical protein